MAARDDLFRSCGLGAAVLARSLATYRSRTWPRARLLADNPHEAGSLRWRLWEVLALADRAVGRRQIERILRHPDSKCRSDRG